MEIEIVRNDLISFIEIDLPKSYNQKKMFSEIWDERPRFSELSERPLNYFGHWQWHWQFLHVLPKGSFPKMKFFKPNIILGLPSEHDSQESFHEFNRRKLILNQVYHEVFYGKEY